MTPSEGKSLEHGADDWANQILRQVAVLLQRLVRAGIPWSCDTLDSRALPTYTCWLVKNGVIIMLGDWRSLAEVKSCRWWSCSVCVDVESKLDQEFSIAISDIVNDWVWNFDLVIVFKFLQAISKLLAKIPVGTCQIWYVWEHRPLTYKQCLMTTHTLW